MSKSPGTSYFILACLIQYMRKARVFGVSVDGGSSSQIALGDPTVGRPTSFDVVAAAAADAPWQPMSCCDKTASFFRKKKLVMQEQKTLY